MLGPTQKMERELIRAPFSDATILGGIFVILVGEILFVIGKAIAWKIFKKFV